MREKISKKGISPEEYMLQLEERNRYLEGLREWDECKDKLLEVVLEAQQRYGAQVELQKLLASNRRFASKDRRCGR